MYVATHESESATVDTAKGWYVSGMYTVHCGSSEIRAMICPRAQLGCAPSWGPPQFNFGFHILTHILHFTACPEPQPAPQCSRRTLLHQERHFAARS